MTPWTRVFNLITNFILADLFAQIFATHGVGGIVGNLLTGLFAQSRIATLDGSAPIDGGWLDKHYIQLAYQLADTVAGVSYSFVVTVRSFTLSTIL